MSFSPTCQGPSAKGCGLPVSWAYIDKASGKPRQLLCNPCRADAIYHNTHQKNKFISIAPLGDEYRRCCANNNRDGWCPNKATWGRQMKGTDGRPIENGAYCGSCKSIHQREFDVWVEL